MESQPKSDPYVYPGTTVLINHFNIRDQEELAYKEGAIFVMQSREALPSGNLDYAHLKAIHHHFFHLIYAWAGQERTVDIAKGESYFANKQFITSEITKLFDKLKQDHFLAGLNQSNFCTKLSYYFNELNAIHPFREGNGRTQRAYCDLVAKKAGFILDWTKIETTHYIDASIKGFNGNYEAMNILLQKMVSPLKEVITIQPNNFLTNTTQLELIRSSALSLTASNSKTFKQLGTLLNDFATDQSDNRQKAGYLASRLLESIVKNPSQAQQLQAIVPELTEQAKQHFIKLSLSNKKR